MARKRQALTERQRNRVEYLKSTGNTARAQQASRRFRGVEPKGQQPRGMLAEPPRPQAGRRPSPLQQQAAAAVQRPQQMPQGQGAGHWGPSISNGNMVSKDLVYHPGNQGGMPPQWAQQEIYQMGPRGQEQQAFQQALQQYYQPASQPAVGRAAFDRPGYNVQQGGGPFQPAQQMIYRR